MSRTPEVSDFLELGLLLIVTGLTGVLVGACVLVLFLDGAGRLPGWLTLILGAFVLIGAVAFAVLMRRLHGFLTGGRPEAASSRAAHGGVWSRFGCPAPGQWK